MEDKSYPNYGCYVDGCEGERCVLDPLCDIYGIDNNGKVDPNECCYTNEFDDKYLAYYNCKYWKLVEENQTHFEHTCPFCGHHFDTN